MKTSQMKEAVKRRQQQALAQHGLVVSYLHVMRMLLVDVRRPQGKLLLLSWNVVKLNISIKLAFIEWLPSACII